MKQSNIVINGVDNTKQNLLGAYYYTEWQSSGTLLWTLLLVYISYKD